MTRVAGPEPAGLPQERLLAPRKRAARQAVPSRVQRRAVDGGQAGKRAVRFSFASSEDKIREAARRLGEYLSRRR